ncbi:MAG: PH domain-containing protein [Bacteroidota bacterium]
MLFQNPAIALEALPQLTQYETHKPEKGLLRLSIIGASIFVFFLLIGAVVMSIVPVPGTLVLISWLMFAVATGLIYLSVVKNFHRKSYSLREHDLTYQSGWLWHSVTTVPFTRVQHVEVDQGPIERSLELATLKIFTAGGSSSDLSIPGLLPEKANQLKTFILQKVSGHDA